MHSPEKDVCFFKRIVIARLTGANPGENLKQAFDNPQNYACEVRDCTIRAADFNAYVEAKVRGEPLETNQTEEIMRRVGWACTLPTVMDDPDRGFERLADELGIDRPDDLD